MGKRKVLFFDIDETLLSHKTFAIPESTKNALRKAKKSGHKKYLSQNIHETACYHLKASSHNDNKKRTFTQQMKPVSIEKGPQIWYNVVTTQTKTKGEVPWLL